MPNGFGGVEIACSELPRESRPEGGAVAGKVALWAIRTLPKEPKDTSFRADAGHRWLLYSNLSEWSQALRLAGSGSV